MRQCNPVWLLLILLLIVPISAHSQTRFFERGDSGFTPSFDLIASSGSSNKFDWEWGARAAYTYKGLFDIGIGFEADTGYEDTSIGPRFIFANVAVIQPKSTKGIGLELKGSFTNLTTETGYSSPLIEEDRDRSYMTGLRGFYRNAPANLIVGLSGIYTFSKDQSLDHSGEVLYGHDYGEVGFTLDGHFLAARLIHFSLQVEYSQNNRYSFLEDWGFRVVLGVGVLVGLNPEPGGK